MITYMLIAITTLTINYNHSSTIFMQEFRAEDDCQRAISYIKSSTRADVSAYCMPMYPEQKKEK